MSMYQYKILNCIMHIFKRNVCWHISFVSMKLRRLNSLIDNIYVATLLQVNHADSLTTRPFHIDNRDQ